MPALIMRDHPLQGAGALQVHSQVGEGLHGVRAQLGLVTGPAVGREQVDGLFVRGELRGHVRLIEGSALQRPQLGQEGSVRSLRRGGQRHRQPGGQGLQPLAGGGVVRDQLLGVGADVGAGGAGQGKL